MVTLTTDLSDMQRELGAYGRQLPFAAANALNRSAQEVQTRLRQELYLKFTIRDPRFMERLVKIRRTDRATKDNLVARVRIEGPGGDENRASVLTRHIDPPALRHSLPDPFFIPTDALRYPKSAKVPRRMYPKNLRVMGRRDIVGTLPASTHVTSGGKVQIQGKRRTFVLFNKSGVALGVYQRGEGRRGKTRREDIERIWVYKHSIHTRVNYPFYKLSDRVFRERWAVNIQGFLQSAIRTAR